jgi:transcriptional regulator with XRE-family HTH domain
MRARAHPYPGDEVIYKAIGETLRELRLESGMSIEQAEKAFREAIAKADYKDTYKALGLAVKEERERQGISRRELSRMSELSVRQMVLLERGQLARMPAAYIFRISYALKISPAALARRFEAIQEDFRGGRQNG